MVNDRNTDLKKQSSKKRRKVFAATGALLVATLSVGLIGSTVATWTDEGSAGQRFSSGEDIFDVMLSVDGGKTWQSNDVEYDDDDEMVVNFSELQFDGNTNESGTPTFSPGQSQTAQFMVKASGNTADAAAVWVSEVGYEGNADVFSWAISGKNELKEEESVLLASADSLDGFEESDGDVAILGAGDTLVFDVNIRAASEVIEPGRTTGYWVISSQEENAYEYETRE